jgi:hypothetical protein
MGKDLSGDAADGGSDGNDSEQGDGEGLGRGSGLSQEMPPAAVRVETCCSNAAQCLTRRRLIRTAFRLDSRLYSEFSGRQSPAEAHLHVGHLLFMRLQEAAGGQGGATEAADALPVNVVPPQSSGSVRCEVGSNACAGAVSTNAHPAPCTKPCFTMPQSHCGHFSTMFLLSPDAWGK